MSKFSLLTVLQSEKENKNKRRSNLSTTQNHPFTYRGLIFCTKKYLSSCKKIMNQKNMKSKEFHVLIKYVSYF